MKGILLCTIASFASLARAADGWGGSIALTSDYLLRGVSQSEGAAALQADLHYDLPSGLLMGLWASSVKLNSQEPTTTEIDAFLGYRWSVGPEWSTKLSAIHYAYPWNDPDAHYDYDEIVAGAAYLDRWFLTVAYSPNTSRYSPQGLIRNRAAFSYDTALQIPLKWALSGSAGIGYYDVSRLVGTGYWYWNAGLGYDFPPLHLDVTYAGTSRSAPALLYNDGRLRRWAVTLMWRF
jgi:uncharacterized protein (TIGR02001 family)